MAAARTLRRFGDPQRGRAFAYRLIALACTAFAAANVANWLLLIRHVASASTDRPQSSPREREVLELIARGQSNGQISSELGISPHTLRNHVARIFAKLGVTRRAQAIVQARQAGYGRGAW
ncbi:response regulator transcription factor [Aquabacterium humicola]|uniref:response regulator transcription factor n=1 Tax=Aquabacterium humicola TaxID=3237377 RepID=UPI002543D478|nr:helix-turn-helix transcriptional regulator [Rubrivivax pictus]